MVEGIVGVGVVVIVYLVLSELIKNKRNPAPLMSNHDKRFEFVNNIKTCDMYECIKR